MKLKEMSAIFLSMILSLVVAAALAACGPVKPDTVHERIETACTTAALSYAVVIEADKIKPFPAATAQRIVNAKRIMDKQCELPPGGDYPYTLNELLLTELEGAADTLTDIKEALR